MLHIYFAVDQFKSNGKRTNLNQQKRGVKTHYRVNITLSFCIPTIGRFRKIIQIRKLVANVGYRHLL